MAALTVAHSLATCHNRLTPIPFDRQMCPRDNSFWDHLTDDEIMTIPPHVAVHAMRTAAQNGAQVISPRQIPSSYMLGRTHLDACQPFLHVVGSEANRDYVWPVPDGHPPIDPRMMEGRVVAKKGQPLARRSPPTAAPVTYATSKVSNPFHRAVLKIKANVDFQNREDVRGDPEELAVAYARLWGQKDDFFSDLSTVTLAHLTDLQSHAISPDTAFARFLGPIQDRRVLTVAVTASSTEAFGGDFSVDWTCLRVSAEAKYAMTVTSEGYNLKELSLPYPVGSYPASSRPSCVIVYHPNPGFAWCHGALTFQIRCSAEVTRMAAPAVMREEMKVGARQATSSDLIKLYDAAVRWISTQVTGASVSRNALAGSVNLIASASSKTLSLGKSAAKAVRQALMESLKSAPIAARRALTRSISVAVPILEEISYSSSDTIITYRFCKYLARRFQTLDGSINAKIVQAAAGRNQNPEDWFATLIGQAPRDLRDLTAGGYGWTVLGMYYMIKPPDDKWRGYVGSIRSVGIDSMADIRTPIPSVAPTETPEIWNVVALRCSTIASSKGDMYSSSYMGVAKAGFVLSAAYDYIGDENLALYLKAAGSLWAFRARCVETVKVVVCEPDTVVPANGRFKDHTFGKPIGSRRVIATMAPYTPYVALIRGMKKLGLLTHVEVPEKFLGKISDSIAAWGEIMDIEEATDFLNRNVRSALLGNELSRYMCKPELLATDLERFLTYAVDDAIAATASALQDMEDNEALRQREKAERERIAEAEKEAERRAAAEAMEYYLPTNVEVRDFESGWTFIVDIESTAAADLMDAYEAYDADAIEILDGNYRNATEFLNRVALRYRADRATRAAANVLR